MSGKLQLAGRMRGALRSLLPAALRIAGSHPEFAPLERDGLTARCVRDWPADPEFTARWNDLLGRNPTSTVFQSPAWQSAIVNEFVPEGRFRLVSVERDGRLLALLPLALNTASMLETPGKWVTDYLDPLVDIESTRESWGMILELLEQLWDWSVAGIQLHNVRGDSILRQTLPGLAPKFGFEYFESALESAPYITLPKTWDEYLASLDSHERKELKRKIRHAREKANMRWVTHTDGPEFLPALDRALAAMRQADPLKADFTEDVLIGFINRLFPTLARQGDFSVQELWLNDTPAAWLLRLHSRRGPMIYNTCYDFAQKQWSPGIVAFGLSIQEAIASGSQVYNLLCGREEYKIRLGARDLGLYRIQLVPG